MGRWEDEEGERGRGQGERRNYSLHTPHFTLSTTLNTQHFLNSIEVNGRAGRV
jgi:hypothetical protein